MALNYTHAEPRVLTSGTCRIPIDSNMNVTLDGVVGHIIFSKIGYDMEGEIRSISMEVTAVTGVKLTPQMLITTDPTVVLAKKMDKVEPWESHFV